jgi:hypothetical protein
MGENLSVFKKELVLVAIPLLFQLGFTSPSQFRCVKRAWRTTGDPARLSRSWEIESTFRRLVEVHSDIRSYIITGEPAFAQAYNHAVAVLSGAIGKW